MTIQPGMMLRLTKATLGHRASKMYALINVPAGTLVEVSDARVHDWGFEAYVLKPQRKSLRRTKVWVAVNRNLDENARIRTTFEVLSDLDRLVNEV